MGKSRQTVLGIALAIALLLTCSSCSQPPTTAAPVPPQKSLSTFVQVRDGKLYDGDQELRFVSFNIPCLHNNEDELAFDQINPWSFPTDFEIADALEAIRQMGGKVARTYTLSVAGPHGKERPYETPKYVLGPGRFNEEAFTCLDRVIAIAEQKNVRLIIPFVDNWKWWGGIADYAAFRGKKKNAFWRDPQVIADFKQTIAYVLNRTNTITGRQYKDEKAILAWETGNELQCPDSWTAEIARYIKSIDTNHLLIDGFYTEVVKQSSIDNPHIDMVTSHHYSLDYKHTLRQIKKNIAATTGAKPYFIGEFGFLPTNELQAILDLTIENDVTGALLWSLRKRRHAGGFYSHSEPLAHDKYKAYHWPGFDSGAGYDEKNVLQLIQRKAAQINGAAPAPLPIPQAPILLDTNAASAISWRGSAGAEGYRVERRENKPDAPWRTIADNVSDAAVQYYPLFNDVQARPGRSYSYRVSAQNAAGTSPPSNVIGPIRVYYRTLVDNCADASKLSLGQDSVTPDASNARSFKEDLTRLAFKSGAIIYKLPTDVIAAKVDSFFQKKGRTLSIAVSSDGKNYHDVKATHKDYSSGAGDYGYWRPVRCEAQVTVPGARFVRITTTAPTQLGRVEITYDRSDDASRRQRHEEEMEAFFAKGFSWGWTGWRGQYAGPGPIESMRKLRETGADWIALSFAGEMLRFNDPPILYAEQNDRMVTDDEIRRAIRLARENGLKVCLKPVVNVRDTTWRAWIKFNRFGGEVANRHKESGNRDRKRWAQWWTNFREFLLHYTAIAEETGCEMLCLGCEMLSTEDFVDEWRSLIEDVRDRYSGPITYNTNHGNINKVSWWDAVDLISISAYYPVGSSQMDPGPDIGYEPVTKDDPLLTAMIKRWQPVKDKLAHTARAFDRKIFFIETGMCSAKDFAAEPWTHYRPDAEYSGAEQAWFYEAIYETFWHEPWWVGVTWWEWAPNLYDPDEAEGNVSFCPYGKPAEELTRRWYQKQR